MSAGGAARHPLPRPFSVGAASVTVAVPVGTAMAGFAARTSGSTGTLDPLTVRAIAIGEDVLLSADVCALHEDSGDRVRMMLGDTGTVVFAATHTHAGPCVSPGRIGRADTALLARIERAAVRAAMRARATRRPARARAAWATGLDIARNRRHPERIVDPPLTAVAFTAIEAPGSPSSPATPHAAGAPATQHVAVAAGDGPVIAWLLSYPCHPVVLDGSNTLVSADYIAALREEVEASSPGGTALFLTGAAGDINTGHSAESSYAPGSNPERSPAQARRIGLRLGRAAVASLAGGAGTPLEAPASAPTGASEPVEVALRPLDAAPPATLAAAWSAERAGAEPGRAALLDEWIRWAHTPGAGEPGAWRGRVSAIDLGGLTLVTLPGEPFLDTAAQIARGLPGPALVVGYSDGCPGYFPTAPEYRDGGYEVIDAHRYYGQPAPAAEGSAELLAEAAVRAARSLPGLGGEPADAAAAAADRATASR